MPDGAGARVFRALIAVGLALLAPVAAGADERIRNLRVWPSQDYTRITIETGAELRYELTAIKNPERLVLDLENVDFLSIVDQSASKVLADDPYVTALRAGRFKPGAVRLVVDLKGEAKPQVFTLKPIGEYGHRLVIDVYPVVPPDPLMALLQRKEAQEPPRRHGAAQAAGPRREVASAANADRRRGRRSRRRGSRRARAARHLREARDARDRAPPEEPDRRRTRHARAAHPRRRLLHSAGGARRTRRGG